MGKLAIGDPSLDRDLNLSQCNVNIFCIVLCSHQVWNPNLSRYQIRVRQYKSAIIRNKIATDCSYSTNFVVIFWNFSFRDTQSFCHGGCSCDHLNNSAMIPSNWWTKSTCFHSLSHCRYCFISVTYCNAEIPQQLSLEHYQDVSAWLF